MNQLLQLNFQAAASSPYFTDLCDIQSFCSLQDKFLPDQSKTYCKTWLTIFISYYLVTLFQINFPFPDVMRSSKSLKGTF